MAERWYLVPVVQCVKNGEPWPNSRCPKHLHEWIDMRWNAMDYGLIDMFLVAADIDPISHAILEADPEVWFAPTDLESALGGPGSNALESFVEAVSVPGNFLKPQDTHREALRQFAGMFQYMQRLTAIMGQSPLDIPGYSLNLQWGTIPTDWQAAMIQAATELGYPTTSMTGNTQLRQIYIEMGEAWGVEPFLMGFTTL